jgi:uncharacterized protein (UPF0332 family)
MGGDANESGVSEATGRTVREDTTGASSAAQSAAQQLWEAHGEPELDRRIASGLRSPDDPVTTWQILVFPDGRQPIVRLEDEVRGVAMVTASRDVEAGEDVLDSEITGLTDFLLLDGDHDDAGHLTVLQIAEGQAIAFDFRYNSAHAAGLSARASEFLFVADAALNAGYFNAFAENAYTAGELLAKAELIVSLDTELTTAKTHKRVLSSYNQQLKLANTSQDAARVLNRLASLRKTARYGQRQSGVTEAEAREMLAVLRAFLERVESELPRRASQESQEPR